MDQSGTATLDVVPSTTAPSAPAPLAVPTSEWRRIVARYQGADVARSLFQLVTTIALLFAALWCMHRLLTPAPWATLLLAIPAGGLLIRTFIIMHDCSHGSFLPWPTVNDAIGFVTGLMTMTPFQQWRRDHALHHASSGDLDRRGYGDIDTLTVREYLALSRWGRFRYRISRHPVALLGIGPLYLALIHRFRSPGVATKWKQTFSIWMTNIAIAALVATFILTVGLKSVLLVYLPSYYIASACGVWLFYVQHQFEDAYWAEHAQWDYATAAITGSSYLRLPKVLQWFTGNIGLHHVHHLGPKIPNYKLQQAHDENALFEAAPVVGIRDGIRALRLALWDEQRRRLIAFSELRAARN
jgi:omega-6 fatty acid desaturase (delta-12 desaturase)